MAPDHNVSATINVPAPIDGVVTERGANVGLNADQATELFIVLDLSTVWVVAICTRRTFPECVLAPRRRSRRQPVRT
jgi:hypothetical protein